MPVLWMDEEVHDKNIKEKIKERKAGKTDLQLGKKGLTKGFINEVKKRLEKNGVVKIRILKSFIKSSMIDRREIARRVAELTGAKLIEVRGYTFILVSTGKGKNNIFHKHGLWEKNKVVKKWLQH